MMPDPKALTAEQIELLRSLPDDGGLSDPVTIDADWSRLNREGMVWFTRSVKGGSSISRTPAADLLLATIDTAVAAERERVLNEVGAIAAEGVASMNTTQQSMDKAIRRRDWGEVCGYIADLYEGRIALNAILAANPQKETDHE